MVSASSMLLSRSFFRFMPNLDGVEVKLTRSSGVLLHPTSLPGPFGIGELGPEAFRFADFLAQSGQRLWQLLPLGPTGYGDSPYQCFSAFAGNPLLVSLETLLEEALLTPADLMDTPTFPDREVDYGPVIQFKLAALKRSFDRFRAHASARERAAFERFCGDHAAWLDDYALFMAVKDAHGGAVWNEWEPDIATRRPAAIEHLTRELRDSILSRKYVQYQFHKQWESLRRYCHDRQIRIIGDIPIFIAFDSADVWAHPELFHLDGSGAATVVAGVPPDYFSATGQLWGNPLYRWDQMARTGYRWWIDRVRTTLSMVDIVRLDHFRGFEAYWEVPASEKTAERGRWVKGPGSDLFRALDSALGELPVIAENLGVITDEVEDLRREWRFPGMAVLQFAFGTDPQASYFRPHHYYRELAAYTGTHDNDTIVGWWSGDGVGHSTRTADEVERERDVAKRYFNTDGHDIHWTFIRAVLGSVADIAVVPLQDVLGLGSEARMNLPARPSGNWRWRFTADQLSLPIAKHLSELTELYDR